MLSRIHVQESANLLRCQYQRVRACGKGEMLEAKLEPSVIGYNPRDVLEAVVAIVLPQRQTQLLVPQIAWRGRAVQVAPTLGAAQVHPGLRQSHTVLHHRRRDEERVPADFVLGHPGCKLSFG
ncbi:unnamed protein product, partial [Prorocentrum cordatum]